MPKNAKEATPLLGNLLDKVERMRDGNVVLLEKESKQEALLEEEDTVNEGEITVEKGLSLLSAMQRAWSDPMLTRKEESMYDIDVIDDHKGMAGDKEATNWNSATVGSGAGMNRSSSMDALLSGFDGSKEGNSATVDELKSHFAGLQNVFEQIEEQDPYGDKEVAELGFVESSVEKGDSALVDIYEDGDEAVHAGKNMVSSVEENEDTLRGHDVDDDLLAQLEMLKKARVLDQLVTKCLKMPLTYPLPPQQLADAEVAKSTLQRNTERAMNDLLMEQQVTARLREEMSGQESKHVPHEEVKKLMAELENERANAERLEKEKRSLQEQKRFLEELTAADDDDETKKTCRLKPYLFPCASHTGLCIEGVLFCCTPRRF